MDVQTRSTIDLNDKQIEVLDWIKSGCSDDVYAEGDFAHRVSARALASRGLVKISGRGEYWKATTTPRGEVWPAATDEDAVVLARQIKLAEVVAETDAKSVRRACGPIEQRRRVPLVKEPSRAEKRQRLVDGLTKRVLLAGEPITLMEEKWDHTELEWMRKAAERSPNRPHGQVLGIRHTGYREEGNYVLYFEPYFRDLVDQTEVIVPEKVSRYLPPVRAFLDDKKRQHVTKEHVPRAARILQAIAAEGVRRGLDMPTYGGGALTFATDQGDYTFEIDELGSWSKERMYADEQRRRINKGTPAWQLAGYQEFTGSGKLRLRQGSPPSGYGNPTFGDRKIVRLEERITEAFIRFEIWRLEEAHREEQRRLEKERRQRAWEAAMVQARIDYVEHAKWEHFKELSRTSEKIEGHRRFLERARLAAQALPEEKQQAAIVYLAKMEVTIDAIDPLATPMRIVPKPKKPRDSELGPFLDGWSPYGPR